MTLVIEMVIPLQGKLRTLNKPLMNSYVFENEKHDR